jgi:hypothetical protein
MPTPVQIWRYIPTYVNEWANNIYISGCNFEKKKVSVPSILHWLGAQIHGSFAHGFPNLKITINVEVKAFLLSGSNSVLLGSIDGHIVLAQRNSELEIPYFICKTIPMSEIDNSAAFGVRLPNISLQGFRVAVG